MLLLRPPSRRDNDVAISLRAPSGCPKTAARVAQIALGSRCPPHVAERVRSCILHSGRYDCRVSAAAAFYISHKGELGAVGGSVTITQL